MKQQNKTALKKIFTIPNVLSFFRICLIPVIVHLYCVEKNYPWTGIVIILSGLTDVIDGFIARRFGMVSDLGKILDPIADKLTQLAVLICLVTRFRWMLLPIVCLVVKEVFVGVTGYFAVRKSGNVPCADWHGKMATVLLYAMMTLHTFWYHITPIVSVISILLCTVMIGVSFVLYGIANIRILTSVPAREEEVPNCD